MRREPEHYVSLSGRGHWTKNQFSVAHRERDVVGYQAPLDLMGSAKILDDDGAASGPMRGDGFPVAAPQPNIVAHQRKIGGRGE